MSGAFKDQDNDQFTSPEQAKFDNKKITKMFVREYLQEDGCFALRLLARNGQDIIIGEVIDRLYKLYHANYYRNHQNTDRSINHSTRLVQNPNGNSSYPSVAPRLSPLEIPNNDDERRRLVNITS
jgi:hypothetical protein